MNIPLPIEVRTQLGTLVLTVDNCCVCVFPEPFKEYQHVFVSSIDGMRSYVFNPKLVDRVRKHGFPLYWRPYPTENDREAYRCRALNQREIEEFTAQLEFGLDWEELEDI